MSAARGRGGSGGAGSDWRRTRSSPGPAVEVGEVKSYCMVHSVWCCSYLLLLLQPEAALRVPELKHQLEVRPLQGLLDLRRYHSIGIQCTECPFDIIIEGAQKERRTFPSCHHPIIHFLHLSRLHDGVDPELSHIVQADLLISVKNLEGLGHRRAVDDAGRIHQVRS